MKNKQTGITKNVPRARPQLSQDVAKKSNYLFWLGLVGIIAGLGGATYLLWPTPGGAEVDETPPKLNASNAPGAAPPGMVWVPGGEFYMGGEAPMHNGQISRECLPMHKVYVDGFWMDKYEVTNAQWAEFAKETGYLTIAEQKPDPRDFPGAKEEDLKDPFSIVFTPPKEAVRNLDVAHQEHLWWAVVRGADWKHPEGKESSITGKDNYPVVHIAYVDAVEYCQWLSKKNGKKFRLPTEAEWEFAARGGLDRKFFTWGDEIKVDGKWMANIWQGNFPTENTAEDGFAGLAPVGSFPPNGYGLHDMAGNAWEWCNDYYQESYYSFSPKMNPRGPESGIDPQEPGMAKRVQRGGSYLCADNYCIRYLVASRGKGEEKSAQNHVGFRCICEAK